MTTLRCRTGAFALVACFPAVLTGCVNQQQRDIQTVDDFKRNTAGQYQSDSGAQLFIVPVRSRMVTDESMYIERHDANGVYARLLDLKISADGEKVTKALHSAAGSPLKSLGARRRRATSNDNRPVAGDSECLAVRPSRQETEALSAARLCPAESRRARSRITNDYRAVGGDPRRHATYHGAR